MKLIVVLTSLLFILLYINSEEIGESTKEESIERVEEECSSSECKIPKADTCSENYNPDPKGIVDKVNEISEWIRKIKSINLPKMCVEFERRTGEYKDETNFECLFLNWVTQEILNNPLKRDNIEQVILRNGKLIYDDLKLEWFCINDKKYLNVYFDIGVLKRISLWIRDILRFLRIRKDFC